MTGLELMVSPPPNPEWPESAIMASGPAGSIGFPPVGGVGVLEVRGFRSYLFQELFGLEPEYRQREATAQVIYRPVKVFIITQQPEKVPEECTIFSVATRRRLLTRPILERIHIIHFVGSICQGFTPFR